jgi:histidine triad (HIT) family protein
MQASSACAVDFHSAMNCLFCQIINGSIPSKAVYQDDQCFAFADIKPQAPVHILIVPRQHIASIAQAGKEHGPLIGHLHWVAAEIARSKGLTNGYRTVINTGEDGGQTVDHIHVHLLGGRPMTWPPG